MVDTYGLKRLPMHLFFAVRMPWLGIPSRGQSYAEVDVWMQYAVLLRIELTKPWLGMPSRGAKAQRRSTTIMCVLTFDINIWQHACRCTFYDGNNSKLN